jgi:hypothetical protein
MNDLFDVITEAYPELTDVDFAPLTGKISLRDDGDGISYIAKWEYSKPIPTGMKLGK